MPVWALGSFLLAFAVLVAVNHHRTRHREFQCPCGLWGLFYVTPVEALLRLALPQVRFSARVGSGVFSTPLVCSNSLAYCHDKARKRPKNAIFAPFHTISPPFSVVTPLCEHLGSLQNPPHARIRLHLTRHILHSRLLDLPYLGGANLLSASIATSGPTPLDARKVNLFGLRICLPGQRMRNG